MSGVYDDRYSNSESPTRYIKQRVADIAPTLDTDDDDPSKKIKAKLKPALWTSIMAGGIAGVIVDLSLYPLDTIKTRLQSKQGFRYSGGFRGIYKGIVPVLLGSAPISALFFATYNTLINSLRTEDSSLNPLVYLIAATAAEMVCATVRVPIEVIKQRKQTSNTRSTCIIRRTLKTEGIPGFYRGFWSTLLREIPFAAIQYPLWEYMIDQFIIYQNGKELTALQTAYCGSAAGAVAAVMTTPMDVVKTRIMLAEKEKIEKFKRHLNYNFAREVYRDRGISGLFAGVVPRVLWIMLGGFIYFGAYEKAKIIWQSEWYVTNKALVMSQMTAPSYCDEKLDALLFSKEGLCVREANKNELQIKDNSRQPPEAYESTANDSETNGHGN